jgi:hypothetical protein
MQRDSDDSLRGSHQRCYFAISHIFQIPQGEHLSSARREFPDRKPQEAAELPA